MMFSHRQENGNSSGSTARSVDFQLQNDPFGRLVLIESTGRRHEGVTPVRAFPLSDPRHWIALCDAAGHELAIIEDLTQLPEDTRHTIERELAQREFVPVIHCVLRVSGTSEPCEWDVETDRGPTSFVLKSEDDVRRLGSHGVQIVDAQGVRFLVPDLAALDAKSRRIVERYV